MMGYLETNISVQGYTLNRQLYVGSRTVVYRGVRNHDRRPVVIKLLRRDHPTPTEIAKFRHQYTIAKKLDLPGVLQPYSLEYWQNRHAFIMEDYGGVALSQHLAQATGSPVCPSSAMGGGSQQQLRPLPLDRFFHIAIQLATILDGLYHCQVIHKDIKPANILIHPNTGQIKLIDFSIASLIPQEAPEVKNPNLLEGTLSYLSPEQTGRMNRGLDFRTDFYSLGVTFYELLTGQLPFQKEDPLDLIYCHIAQQALPIDQINGEIPSVLSQLVAKLMAKNAEDRYQSALGLKQDLQQCQQQWLHHGTIAPFELGQRDVCSRFAISEKLYGRETEVNALLAAFQRVVDDSHNGSCELMLIAGYSGVGKTAIVNEVHKPILQRQGYFAQGKFDQFQRNIPLSALVQALRALVGQLLGQDQSSLDQWREKISAAVGTQGQLIIDVIPEVGWLIGPQPPVEALAPEASQSRFNRVLQRFIQSFPSTAHPLVLFLDDLQWADMASLTLIQGLLTQKTTHHLLILGAYRDNEVSPTHPLTLTLEQMLQNGISVNTLHLHPLTHDNLNQLIADTLNCSRLESVSLTQPILNQTQGNPFFITQFLKTLYERQCIQFDFDADCWRWDLSQIQALSLSDDVVTFMVGRLQQLSAQTQHVLMLAACIGNTFDLQTLSVVSGQSLEELEMELWHPLQNGLLLLGYHPISKRPQISPQGMAGDLAEPTSTARLSSQNELSLEIVYKFLHDRVRQAAYSLVPAAEKPRLHLKIGRLLLNTLPDHRQEASLFTLVGHLNLGLSLISDRDEQISLAEMNLRAGQQAKLSGAYSSAFDYLSSGIELMGNHGWKTHLDLMVELHGAIAEVAYLQGKFTAMESYGNQVLTHSSDLLSHIKIYETKITAYQAQGESQAAIDTGLKALQQLGVSLPANPRKPQVMLALVKTKLTQGAMPFEALIDLPVIEDPYQLAVMGVIAKVLPIAYTSRPLLFALIVLKQVGLSLRWGNCAQGTIAYVAYAIALWTLFGDIDAAYRLGRVALTLSDRFGVQAIQPMITYVATTFTQHWQRPLKETLPPLLKAYTLGLEVGDLEHAAYSGYIICCHRFWLGESLPNLAVVMANYHREIAGLNQDILLPLMAVNWQTVLNLLGDAPTLLTLQGEVYNAAEMAPIHQHQDKGNRQALFLAHFQQLFLNYLFGHYQDALSQAQQAAPYLDAVPAQVVFAIYHFYRALTCLALAETADPTQRKRHLAQANRDLKKLNHWAKYGPKNYAHRVALVQAEKYRILGQTLAAIEAYEQAIALAETHQYFQDLGLAQELAGKFYLVWGKPDIARTYLTNAYYSYENWGATTKLSQLKQQYQTYLPASVWGRISPHPDATSTQHTNFREDSLTAHTTNTSNSLSLSQTLDTTTVLKASQALSSELQLEHLLATLMQVLIENAGAQQGALLLSKNGDLAIEVEAYPSQHPQQPLEIITLQATPLADSQTVPITLINYVIRTHKTLVLQDATTDTQFATDPYLIRTQPKSVLCVPIRNQGKLLGILYLENNLVRGAFTCDRLEILQLLTTQAAISLENATLYDTLEQQVAQRTQALKEKNAHLKQAMADLKQTQAQLIQTEKMSGLGQMVAGLAHEINNPVNFIHGNLTHVRNHIHDLRTLIDAYQQAYPAPHPVLDALIEDIDLDYLIEDLPSLLKSMQTGSNRIKHIILGLRNFSRLDESEMKPVDIHEGLDSTLMILHHRLRDTTDKDKISIDKHYSPLPKVTCYASQLNQVFMNILANAIDALDSDTRDPAQPGEANSTNYRANITIRTASLTPERIQIQIADNGPGIPEAIHTKIFDPFFTTKPVGSGTGLGLSISHQIVVEKHQGNLICQSVPGQGTTFIIEIPIAPVR